jgi:hypothetical protein
MLLGIRVAGPLAAPAARQSEPAPMPAPVLAPEFPEVPGEDIDWDAGATEVDWDALLLLLSQL